MCCSLGNASTEDLDKFLRASEEEFYEGEEEDTTFSTTMSTTMSTTDSSIAKVSHHVAAVVCV